MQLSILSLQVTGADVADVALKTFEFRVVGVYAPNSIGDRRSFFRRLWPFLDDSKQLVLVDD